MKRTVRRGCFETNSSSMHSIVVTKNDTVYTNDDYDYPLKMNGVLKIYSNEDLEFERYPFRILSTLEEKVMYTIASYCGFEGQKVSEEFVKSLEDILRDKIEGFKKIELPENYAAEFKDTDGNILSNDDVFYDRTEGKKYFYCYRDRDGVKHDAVPTGKTIRHKYYGYVDHQSSGLLQNFLSTNGIPLSDFLLNRKYIVIIDGDCGEFCKMKKSGIIDLDTIVQEF